MNQKQEDNNPFDMFAIKIRDGHKTVGHLPMEISRPTKYLMDMGGTCSIELSSTNYRRSPPVQGGLKIPAIVTVIMPGTVKKTHMIIDKYREIITYRYAEPKQEEILSSFMSLPPMHQISQTQPAPQNRLSAAKLTLKRSLKNRVEIFGNYFKRAEKNANTRKMKSI